MIITFQEIKDIFNNTGKILKLEKPVDILIPVYNGKNFLKNLLESIIKNTFTKYRLLICDDCSTDNDIFHYLLEFKNIHKDKEIYVYRNEKNLGFVKTINKLIDKTENHFVIINTDVVVPEYWLQRLIFPIISLDNIASTTPFSNSGIFCSFPEFIIDNKIFFNLTVDEIDKCFRLVNTHKTFCEIPSGVGFCMGINRTLIDKIGKFDEIFGKGYGEETDWCLKAKRAGYKNIIVTNLYVYHKHGGSFKSKERIKLQNKNLNIIIKRYPEYKKLLKNFINEDPLKKLREIMYFVIASKYIEKSVLIIDNKKNKININLKNYNMYGVMSYNQINKNYFLTIFHNNKNLTINFNNMNDFKEILNYFNFKEFHYV